MRNSASVFESSLSSVGYTSEHLFTCQREERHAIFAVCDLSIGLLTSPVFAQAPPDAKLSSAPKVKDSLVEFEMMTWPEVKAALAAGKTTALFYTGGTEQRRPQNVNGGHNLMAKATVKEIALRLGNAIAMPVLPYSPNEASAELPGTIGLTGELLGAILERISEQAITTGFKNIILMGDHGGGQPKIYAEVARKFDEKDAPNGIHVYYSDDVYKKRKTTSIVGSSRAAFRAVRTLASPIPRRCSTRAATRVGFAKS
jgi:hypothetical protein